MKRMVLMFAALLTALPVFAQNAADAYYDPEEMEAARAAIKAEHGTQQSSLLFLDRLEYQSRDGDPELLWDGQGWRGGDIEKFWFKTEGEYITEENRFGEAELQALYSRAVSPFWDVQLGLRHDIKPDPSRSYLVLGVQGLARYWFELDGAFFISHKGDVSIRVEAEYELRLTQQWILQPRVELNAALSEDDVIGMGSGVNNVEAGLRLRYEITRQIAPYAGVSWTESYGETVNFAQAEGEDRSQASFVTGIRLWF